MYMCVCICVSVCRIFVQTRQSRNFLEFELLTQGHKTENGKSFTHLLVALTRLSHGYYLPGPQLLYIPDPSKAPFFHISFNPVNYPLIPPINMFFQSMAMPP